MLLLIAIAIGPGLLLGLARGGRLSGLADLSIAWPAVPAVALCCQAALGLVAEPTREAVRIPVVLGSYGLLGVWLGWNARRAKGGVRLGFALVAMGWLCNLLPITVNGGMPVSPEAIAVAGASATHGTDEAIRDGNLFKHVALTEETRLAGLGDVIGVPPPVGAAISVGDLFLAVGLGGLAMAGTSPAVRASRPTTTSGR